MSADSEKICERFTDFPASGPILQPKGTYPFTKWRTLKVNLLGKKGRLMKRRSTFLYHSGRNIPAFLTKLIPTTKTKTNAPICFTISRGRQIRHDKSQHVNRPLLEPAISGFRVWCIYLLEITASSSAVGTLLIYSLLCITV